MSDMLLPIANKYSSFLQFTELFEALVRGIRRLTIWIGDCTYLGIRSNPSNLLEPSKMLSFSSSKCARTLQWTSYWTRLGMQVSKTPRIHHQYRRSAIQVSRGGTWSLSTGGRVHASQRFVRPDRWCRSALTSFPVGWWCQVHSMYRSSSPRPVPRWP